MSEVQTQAEAEAPSRHQITPLGAFFAVLGRDVFVTGRELPILFLTAIHRDARISVRTDAHGRAALSLPKSGAWLIKSVYIVKAPKDSGVDWESLWASLTFER